MPYKGSDLGQDFKDFYRKEKKRLTAIFKEKGCTNIKMDYGFYFFSGFFTAPQDKCTTSPLQTFAIGVMNACLSEPPKTTKTIQAATINSLVSKRTN